MKIIAGLGNPGTRYNDTRHNIGFAAIDSLCVRWRGDSRFFEVGRQMHKTYESYEFDWYYEEAQVKERIVLVKPLGYMNRSGECLKELVSYASSQFDISGDLIVIHDEVALALGRLKIDKNASSAGHNGVQNIIDQLGTKDFIRLRIGIRPPSDVSEPLEDFVLKKFSNTEREKIMRTLARVGDAIDTIFLYGVERGRALHNVHAD